MAIYVEELGITSKITGAKLDTPSGKSSKAITNIVLFGAGASYGSGDVIPYPPPLGKELYNKLKFDYPHTWGKLPEKVDEKFTENFEVGMQLIWEAYPNDVPQLMRNMAEYFSRFNPPPANNSSSNLYVKFLGELKPLINNILFSSLNYDLLFEDAAKYNELMVSYFLQNKVNINFLKLHGSCNFLPRGAEFIDVTFNYPALIDIELQAVDASQVIKFCNSHTSAYPAMCLYMKSKPTQFGYPRILELQSNWEDQVSRAERILIIGARPYPPDRHIWKPLYQTDAKLGYIGSKSAFTRWIDPYRNNKDSEYIGEWSSHFVQSLDFLRLPLK
jgi:hypothetical protein